MYFTDRDITPTIKDVRFPSIHYMYHYSLVVRPVIKYIQLIFHRSHDFKKLILNLFLVHTDSIFTVQSMQSSSESKYTESITYECPLLFSSFCKKEILHQRNKIYYNLQNIFINRKNHKF